MTTRTRTALVAGATTPLGGAIADRLTRAGFDLGTSGPLDVAVYAALDQESLTPRRLTQIDEATFGRWCEAPMRAFLEWMQPVHERLSRRSGTLVLVAPTVSQEGAAGLVPYATAVEGQRLLAKSAARQWAPEGVTVVIVAPRLEVLLEAGSSLGEGTDATRTSPVLGAPYYGIDAVAGVVSMLASSEPGARPLSGATIPVDGGALMAP
ncbi:MAG: SDR family oxidoreductase [Actinobacteria bacterium]|nr:SDR family oxidoreductase [Actinomycetota bacterium]